MKRLQLQDKDSVMIASPKCFLIQYFDGIRNEISQILQSLFDDSVLFSDKPNISSEMSPLHQSFLAVVKRLFL